MLFLTNKGLITISIFLSLFLLCSAQTDFGYPEDSHESSDKRNKDARKPLYIPNRCEENEFLYPGDKKDDWICDCKPGYIYDPNNSKCYHIYHQGPCKSQQFLILPKGKVVPECASNPCQKDKHVVFQSTCYELDRAGPCKLPELSYVVGVNVTTLEVMCVKQSVKLADRFSIDADSIANMEDLPEIIPKCAAGSKRAVNLECVPSTSLF